VAPRGGPHGIDDPHRLVIVHDELDLPVGRMKLKLGGGLAGNNGLKSEKAHLPTDDFARIRIGIGKPPGRAEGADHVLKRPGKADRAELDVVVQEAADAVEAILSDGFDAAMNRYNTKPEPA
jgi:PTH1 family peptidyl-tRNA hydrolase